MAPLEGQSVNTPRRPIRHRLYFWLMDICLFFAVIGLIDWLLGRIWDMTLMPDGSIPYTITGILVTLFNAVVPPFLLVARFMRDEYSELLWQRAVKVLTYTITVIPFFLWLTVWGFYWGGYRTGVPAALNILETELRLGPALLISWFVFQLLFVLIFQIVRWKDSR
jgi:hypothetical protein